MVNSASNRTPRFRADLTGLTSWPPTNIGWLWTLSSCWREPIHRNSVVVVVVVVVVVLSSVDVGDPRCQIHGDDAIFTHLITKSYNQDFSWHFKAAYRTSDYITQCLRLWNCCVAILYHFKLFSLLSSNSLQDQPGHFHILYESLYEIITNKPNSWENSHRKLI